MHPEADNYLTTPDAENTRKKRKERPVLQHWSWRRDGKGVMLIKTPNNLYRYIFLLLLLLMIKKSQTITECGFLDVKLESPSHSLCLYISLFCVSEYVNYSAPVIRVRVVCFLAHLGGIGSFQLPPTDKSSSS